MQINNSLEYKGAKMGKDLLVVSVSIGSTEGDHVADFEFLGNKVRIVRIGTSGSIENQGALFRYFDQMDRKGHSPVTPPKGFDLEFFGVNRKPDAFGLGGTTVYLFGGHTFRDGRAMLKNVKNTPLLDGYGLKLTLERRVVEILGDQGVFFGSNVLVTSIIDREGMGEAFYALKKAHKVKQVIFGDFMYLLGMNFPISRYRAVSVSAKVLLPVFTKLPISLFYATGEKQKEIVPRWQKYQGWADFVAGDCHQILEHLAPEIKGKTIITNTTTKKDVETFRSHGVRSLITTTPQIEGRTNGTNVWEGVFVACGAEPRNYRDYYKIISEAKLGPNIIF